VPSPSNHNPSQEQANEQFVAAMKARLEQARADGQSPEQMQQLAMALGHKEAARRAPQVVAQVRSWWSGFRLFLKVGALACVLAIGLAWLIEHRHAAPLCELYATEHRLSYRQLNYTNGGHGTNAGSARCVFADPSGREKSISLAKLEPNFAIDMMVSVGLEIEFTLPAFFLIVALIFGAIERSKGKRGVA